MQTSNVPSSDITKIKATPELVFEKARAVKTGLYIFDHHNPVGVILSVNTYENMVAELEQLRDALLDQVVEQRLNGPRQIRSDVSVRGDNAKRNPVLDDTDDWD